ncbi:MAG: 23S rRNA (guanosine(2251)-2'-O)-methyltransferase RlmB [Acidimicrobiia bacterium]|nr:23S rRNA (guanosine(2251)-2'-O)-methyltransferase RlmB [Acidimicrobiia bacterium]
MARGRSGDRRRSGGGSRTRGPKDRSNSGGAKRGSSQRKQSSQRGTTPIRTPPTPAPDTAGPAGSTGEGRRNKGPGGDRIEGRQAVRELLLADRRKVLEVVMQTGLDNAPILEDIQMLAEDRRITIRELGRSAFHAQTDTDSAQGVFAEAEPIPTIDLEDLIDEPHPFLVMVDGLTDPHNLGAIFRSADAAGVTGIILPRHRSARISATVAKTAAGAIEHVPIATVAGVPAAIQLLQKRDVWVVGLDESGSRSIFDLDLADQPLCLVLGAEGPGLSRLTRERCDQLVSIPMQGAVASLNVSAAATVAMFDVSRRRLGLGT